MKRLWFRGENKHVTKHYLSRLVVVIALIGGIFALPGAVHAQYSSPNYRIEEAQLGTGADNNLSSPSYSGQASAGSLGVGTVASSNYGAEAGFLTPNEPFLEFIVDTTQVDFGTLSASSTASGSATFSVRAYVNSGYTVQTMGNPPTSEGGATLANLTSATAPSPGTEQFGMNLVKNTNFCGAGCDLGNNPAQAPDSTFAAGQAAAGYNTPGLFKYVKGDIVAQSGAKGWGKTSYTISYIANMSPISKAGHYVMNQDLVVVATY